MRQLIFDLFGFVVFTYSLCMIASYVWMAYRAGRSIIRDKLMRLKSYDKELVENNPYTPGVSVVVPCHNESIVVIDSVNSFLSLDYPKFEVIIVNDGSTDDSLEKLSKNYSLVPVQIDYIEKIHTAQFRGAYMSTDPKYANITVLDKISGGSKADAVNAGLNVAKYHYFINTDMDCILSSNAIIESIKPVMKMNNVIAVSGAMTMSNGCKVEHSRMTRRDASHELVPLFQTLEYMRSFFIGKMAWSSINGMPNVSGGYGLFSRDIMIAAGGYRGDSMAEDMEMVCDAVRYCCDFNIPYRIVQIPCTCCWTEGPSTLKVLFRQRSRWARGLLQTFIRHGKMLFNPRYKVTGMVTLPYLFIFEFLAPIIEITGMIEVIYLSFTGGINYSSAAIIFSAIYLFNVALASVTAFYDSFAATTFDKKSSYIPVVAAALIEPFIYHPFLTIFSIIGYFKYIFNTSTAWGEMTRKGHGGS